MSNHQLLLAALSLLPLPQLASGQQPAPDTVLLSEVRVVSTPAALSLVPGSATLLGPAALEVWRSTSANDVLRRVPGITIREEEGLGLRPNIGVRGLNSTRSTKVLLLEDGIPVTFAPYGDNASYYHPPISRFDQVEVVRGAGQIAFGPQTVGGVINYLTPAIPGTTGGRVSIAGGDQGFLDLSARGTTTIGRFGALASVSHREGQGARENIGAAVSDAMVKATAPIGQRQRLTLRGNVFRERSNVTYSGLTEAEWAQDPTWNPFQADSMLLDRWAASAMHAYAPSPVLRVTTTAYVADVDRAWWRQSSNSAQRPNDASDPTCGGMANLNTTCGNEGRHRVYRHYGIEPRLSWSHQLLGAGSTLELGARWHQEEQNRLQLNGATPSARKAGPAGNGNSGVREDNERRNTAWSAFVQQRVSLDRFSVTPGLRVEHVQYERTNRLNGATGQTELTQLIPGAGLTFEVRPGLLLFGGAHRGFSPPRTEDIIDNSSGSVAELDPELSWNYEAGVRGHRGPINAEFTLFRMDFENQVIPASVAGGTGAALTNSGRTLHQGLEFGLRFDASEVVNLSGPYLEASATWVPTARFEGERFAWIGTAAGDTPGKVYAAQNGAGTRQRVDVNGNRLPYAPETNYTVAVGFQRDEGLDLRLERFGVSEQFGDPVNTRVTVPDGQQGPISGYGVWNVSASQPLPRAGTRLFLSLRNVTDALYVADRTRGLVPGAPRSVQFGLRQEF